MPQRRSPRMAKASSEGIWSYPDRGEAELLDLFEAVVGHVKNMPGDICLTTIRDPFKQTVLDVDVAPVRFSVSVFRLFHCKVRTENSFR